MINNIEEYRKLRKKLNSIENLMFFKTLLYCSFFVFSAFLTGCGSFFILSFLELEPFQVITCTILWTMLGIISLMELKDYERTDLKLKDKREHIKRQILNLEGKKK